MSQETGHSIAGIDSVIENLDFDAISRTYQDQNEFLLIERFLSPEAVAPLVVEAESAEIAPRRQPAQLDR